MRAACFLYLLPHALALSPGTMSRALSVRGGGLLKGINPLLTADLLHVLRSAGHGDVLAVVDCNFPAASVATETTSKQHILLAGASAPETLDAIASILPLDLFVERPLGHMVPSPGASLPPAGAVGIEAGLDAVRAHCSGVGVEEIERFEFYERAKQAYAVVQCSERRPYACFLLQKGQTRNTPHPA